MKKIILALAAFVITSVSAHALTGTNSWKYKAATNVSDVMERAMTNGYVYAGHTNYVTMRNKWQGFIDILIADEFRRIYREQRTRDANEAAKVYWDSITTGIETNASGD